MWDWLSVASCTQLLCHLNSWDPTAGKAGPGSGPTGLLSKSLVLSLFCSNYNQICLFPPPSAITLHQCPEPSISIPYFPYIRNQTGFSSLLHLAPCIVRVHAAHILPFWAVFGFALPGSWRSVATVPAGRQGSQPSSGTGSGQGSQGAWRSCQDQLLAPPARSVHQAADSAVLWSALRGQGLRTTSGLFQLSRPGR